EVDGDQRGRAGRVDGYGRPLQAEGVGDPSGHHAAGRPGQQPAAQVVQPLYPAGGIAQMYGAYVGAGGSAAEGFGVDAGTVEGLPGELKDEALLRIGGEGFAGAHPEEVRVEVGGVVKEAAMGGVGRAGMVGVGVVEILEVPSAVLRKGRD